MGLTDREKKIIEEMEAALQAEDPRLVATMERSRPSLFINLAAIFLGMGLLLAGVIAKTSLLGLLGFLVALAGAATIRIKPRAIKVKRNEGPGKMQARWDRRNQ